MRYQLNVIRRSARAPLLRVDFRIERTRGGWDTKGVLTMRSEEFRAFAADLSRAGVVEITGARWDDRLGDPPHRDGTGR